MVNKSILLFLSFFCSAIFINCSIGSDNLRLNHTKDEIGQKYYFVMDKKKQIVFYRKINRIKHGDTVVRVKDILGAPSDDKKLVDKGGVFKARILTYYIKLFKKDQVNELYDRFVSVIFNIDDRLTDIDSNAEGFKYAPKR